jgi:hypothetical protein
MFAITASAIQNSMIAPPARENAFATAFPRPILLPDRVQNHPAATSKTALIEVKPMPGTIRSSVK